MKNKISWRNILTSEKVLDYLNEILFGTVVPVTQAEARNILRGVKRSVTC